jgi:hypothetical protein
MVPPEEAMYHGAELKMLILLGKDGGKMCFF